MSNFRVRDHYWRDVKARLNAITLMGLGGAHGTPARKARGCVNYDRRCAEIQKRREVEA